MEESKVNPSKKAVRIADQIGPSTSDQRQAATKLTTTRRSSLEKVPRLRSQCGVHYALAFLLKDAQLDSHESAALLDGIGTANSVRFAVALSLEDGARSLWPRTKLGLVTTYDKKTHFAVILSHNASVEKRKVPSKELVEEMKKLMKISWDPHWYRCESICKA